MGPLPESWSSLVNLKELHLLQNQLTGNLPLSWSSLINLQSLDLEGNKLAGILPANYSSLVGLRILILDYNQFTGPLPESWSALVKLEVLLLGQNQLSGSLPVNWSSLVSLWLLDLEQNRLTGSLPESWSSLVNLTQLYLSRNQLTGSLPESWSSLVNLTNFTLYNNQLSGALPESWKSLVNLKVLYLNDNQFTGRLPESWTALFNLKFLSIKNNRIIDIPDLSNLTTLDNLTVGNNSLDFGDIEPNIGGPNLSFTYSPQALVGEPVTLQLKEGEQIRISVNIGGGSNKYQWYKDGTAIPSAVGPGFLMGPVNKLDAGIYTCQITNTVATGLILTSHPYTVIVKAASFFDATLQDLSYEKIRIPNFTPNVFSYNVELPYEYASIPILSATPTNHEATVQILQATSLPGLSHVKVTAEDGSTINTYSVLFSKRDASTDASLRNLFIDGVPLKGFDTRKLIYQVILPCNFTGIPAVTAEINSEYARYNIANPQSLPGTAFVNVVAQDGTTTEVYQISFTKAVCSTIATLSQIIISGSPVIICQEDVFEYVLSGIIDTQISPEANCVLNDGKASYTINIHEEKGAGGWLRHVTFSFHVTAEDGVTRRTYTVNMSFALSGMQNDGLLYQLTVYPNPSDGNFEIRYARDGTQSNEIEIQVMDVTGRILFHSKRIMESCELTAVINMPRCEAGGYIIKLRDRNDFLVRRLIIY